jgi:hypothetical protein
VLQPKHSCTIFIIYAPSGVGPGMATLNVLDSAVGNPQQYGLSGTGTSIPVVMLNPSGTFNLTGTTTQGTTAPPQNLTVSNTGTGPLHVTAIGVSGLNAADFSVAGSNCLTTAVAAGANCTIAVTFAPLAAGIRTTTLSITDDAGNSPQMVTLNATAAPAATIVAPAGSSLSASVSAGQTAAFNLQAAPGAGFTGTLAFTCSGMPVGTNCNAPSVTVTNGATANFTISVTTSGSAAFAPGVPRNFPGVPRFHPVPATALLLLLAFCLYVRKRKRSDLSGIALDWKSAATLICLAFLMNGCGGGSASSSQQPPPIITPSGTYTLMATPTATPAGSSKSYPLSPISLTLVVK